jgi:hypothetical protein
MLNAGGGWINVVNPKDAYLRLSTTKEKQVSKNIKKLGS